MALKHNKKRNVGLLNEFFARYIAKSIIEKDDLNLKKSRLLFKKHFQKGTELNRELRLFTSLFESSNLSPQVAISLINQVKKICKLQSQKKLDLEKTALLHEINLTFGDSAANFFNQDISEFREYGSIQVLLNHWRNDSELFMNENFLLSEVTTLEEKLFRRLTSQPTKKEDLSHLNMTNDDIDNLVVNLMTQKLNEKYQDALNSDQKKLLEYYVFSEENEQSREKLYNFLQEINELAQVNINSALNETTGSKEEPLNTDTKNKLLEIKKILIEKKETGQKLIDDEIVTFYMNILKLREELN